jgi:hypothetical protein
MDTLEHRIRLVYAALAATVEKDVDQFRPKVYQSKDKNFFSVVQDFRGGMTDEQIALLAQAAIYNVAHIRDHMRARAKQRGVDRSKVVAEAQSGTAMSIVIDLSNMDKHAGTDREGGHSRKNPTLINVDRVLQIGATSEGPGAATYVMGGPLIKSGSGYGEVVVDGDIVDNHGTRLGGLRQILNDAVTELEAIIQKYQLRI